MGTPASHSNRSETCPFSLICWLSLRWAVTMNRAGIWLSRWCPPRRAAHQAAPNETTKLAAVTKPVRSSGFVRRFLDHAIGLGKRLRHPLLRFRLRQTAALRHNCCQVALSLSGSVPQTVALANIPCCPGGRPRLPPERSGSGRVRRATSALATILKYALWGVESPHAPCDPWLFSQVVRDPLLSKITFGPQRLVAEPAAPRLGATRINHPRPQANTLMAIWRESPALFGRGLDLEAHLSLHTRCA